MQEVQTLMAKLEQAQTRLAAEKAKALTASVQDIVADLPFERAASQDIVTRGPSFPEFLVRRMHYHTGMGQLPMDVFRRAKVLDFSTYLVGVFQAPGANIKEKVLNFLSDKWDDIQTYDLYLLPIDIQAKAQGRKKCDLPNVTFVLVAEFIKREIPLIVADPVHMGTDATVGIIDFRLVYRSLQDMHVKVQMPFSRNKAADALEFIVYQYGAGDPTEKDMQALTDASGLDRHHVLRMHLVPGKYEQGKCTWGGSFRRDVEKSVALILHELHVVTPFTKALGKRSVHKLWFVLDPFSLYSAFTSVAIQAFGLEEVAGVLCYRQGRYTPM